MGLSSTSTAALVLEGHNYIGHNYICQVGAALVQEGCLVEIEVEAEVLTGL